MKAYINRDSESLVFFFDDERFEDEIEVEVTQEQFDKWIAIETAYYDMQSELYNHFKAGE